MPAIQPVYEQCNIVLQYAIQYSTVYCTTQYPVCGNLGSKTGKQECIQLFTSDSKHFFDATKYYYFK